MRNIIILLAVILLSNLVYSQGKLFEGVYKIGDTVLENIRIDETFENGKRLTKKVRVKSPYFRKVKCTKS